MKFEERLLNTRKLRGMSQEALAEKIGVSRQAVSKWETGDAQPDYTKLIALADAMEVSLDYLCGRDEAPVSNPEVPAPVGTPKKRKVWPWLVGALTALVLVGAGMLIGWSLSDNAVKEPLELPEEFFVKDVSFNYVEGEGLHYQFTPSVAGRGYSYHVTATGGGSYFLEAKYEHGVCSGVLRLEPHEGGYDIRFMISNGFQGVRAKSRFMINHDGSLVG